jgi:hypothetical protein
MIDTLHATWCEELAVERGALERARDAHEPAAMAVAVTLFTTLVAEHVTATGCTDRH